MKRLRFGLVLAVSCSMACGPSTRSQTAAHQPDPRDASTASACITPPAAPPSSVAAVAAVPTHAGESCGELAMTRAALLAGGKGTAHPEVRAVEAILAGCNDAQPDDTSCTRVRRELVERRASGYGPNHPAVRALEAKLSLCQG